MAVRAVRVVVADSASVGASPTASPSASASPTTVPQAYLLASFVNRADTADTLTSATVAGSQVEPVNASSTGGGATGTVSLSLPPHQVVQVGTPDAGFTGTALGVGALPTPLVPGETTTVTFTFQTAGTVTVDVPIMTTSDIGTTASAYPVTATG